MKRAMLVIVWLLVMNARQAVAQTELPRIPQPMRYSDLTRYMEALNLSDEQRRAVENHYESYIDEYEALRPEMIEITVQFPQQGSEGSDENFIRRLPTFVSSVRALDDGLLARIESLLTPAQREALPPVRAHRERLMYGRLDVVARFIGDVTDLRDLLELLNPTAETLDAVTPALITYEQRLSNAIRGIYDAAIRVCVSDQPSVADVLIERVRSTRALQRRTHREIGHLLPQTMQRQWRDEFFRHDYGEAVEATEMWVIGQCQAALARPDLEQHDRHAISKIHAEAQQLFDGTVDELADVFDGDAIRHSPGGGMLIGEGFLDALNNARRQTADKSHEMQKKLASILGETRFAGIKDKIYKPRSLTRATWRRSCNIVARTQQPIDSALSSSGLPGWRTDPLLSMPISTEAMEDYMSALRVSPSQREAALGFYRAYINQLDNDLEKPRQQRMMLPFARGATGAEIDPAERLQELGQIRATVLATIQAADAQLFEKFSIALELGNDHPGWQRILRARQRSMITLDLPCHHPPDASRSAEIDLIQVLMRELGPAFEAQVDSVASEYEAQLHELLLARWDLYIDYSSEELSRRLGGNRTSESYQRLRELTDELHRSHAAIGELNTSYVARISATLPPESAAAFLETYNRLAYPKVFEDVSIAEPSIVAASLLSDLTAHQREGINALSIHHRAEYANLQHQLIDTCQLMPMELPMIGVFVVPDRAAKQEQFVQRWAQATDQRASINRRTLRELKLMLTPSQVTRVPWPSVE